MSCVRTSTADDKLNDAQEQLMDEAFRQVGMPNIMNYTQRKTLKWIQELCDQEKLINYAYTFSEMTGKYTYIGQCYGFALPFSTQFTNPEKVEYHSAGGYTQTPQADPNGLWMPSSSEASWIIMLDKNGKPHPSYSEPRLYISAYPLDDDIVMNSVRNPKY
jgi:hypothetical protein